MEKLNVIVLTIARTSMTSLVLLSSNLNNFIDGNYVSHTMRSKYIQFFVMTKNKKHFIPVEVTTKYILVQSVYYIFCTFH